MSYPNHEDRPDRPRRRDDDPNAPDPTAPQPTDPTQPDPTQPQPNGDPDEVTQ